MFRHLRPQIALAAVGLALIAALLFGVSRQAFGQRPARGGQLVEALVGRPATLNPLFAVQDTETDLVRLLFGGLTRPGSQGEVMPNLATRWSVSEDGLEYTFWLRTDALWHDGFPVTAEDVSFTAALAADRNLPHKAPRTLPWEHVTAEILDDHTVLLRLQEPYAPFLTATALPILPAHILADVRPIDLPTDRFSTLAPIGSGPYRLVTPGGITDEGIRLTRFDEHWAATDRQPYLDEVFFRIYDTSAAALEALAAHEVQAMGGVPPNALALLGDEATPASAIRSGYTLVYLNPAHAALGDRTVRRALSLALDRSAIATGPDLLNGEAREAASPISPGSWAFDPSVRPTHIDRSAAEEILEEAGWIDSDGDGIRDRDGRNLAFSLEMGNEPLLVAIGQAIASQWAAIGVEAATRTLDQLSTVQNLKSRAFDAMLFAWGGSGYDPDPYPVWHSSQADDGQNYAGWRNEEADLLMVRARRSHPEDLEGRAVIYHGFQRLFAEEEPALMLYHPVYTYVVVDPSLGGVQLPQLITEPSDRFMTLSDWFVHTELVWRSDGAERRGADD